METGRRGRVLVISRYFAPQSMMGAIRPTKIAKYLKLRHGCDITVVCEAGPVLAEDPALAKDRALLDKVIEVEDARWVKTLMRLDRRWRVKAAKKQEAPATQWAYPPKDAPLIQRLVWTARVLLEWCKEAAFARRADKELRGQGLIFDAVFSTYGPPGVHYLAYKVKRRQPSIRWVADFRDPPISGDMSGALLRLRTRRLVRMLGQSTAVTMVTGGIAQDMGYPRDAVVHVIPNGYDLGDLAGLADIQPDADSFCMVYTGVLYGQKRNLNLLFQALEELVQENAIDPARLRFDYAGPDFEALCVGARQYGMDGILRNHGAVDRRTALRLQKSARLLVLSSFSERGGTNDVIPGKLYEYMMMGRPVAAIICGDKAGTTVAQRVREARLGVCCEQAAGQTGYRELKEFLARQYAAFVQGLPPIFAPDNEYLARFSYTGIAAEMAGLMGL